MRYQFHPGKCSDQAIGFPEHYNTAIQFSLFILDAAGYSHFPKQNFNDFFKFKSKDNPFIKISKILKLQYLRIYYVRARNKMFD